MAELDSIKIIHLKQMKDIAWDKHIFPINYKAGFVCTANRGLGGGHAGKKKVMIEE